MVKFSVINIASIFLAMGNFSQLDKLIEQRDVLYKHRYMDLYQPYLYVLISQIAVYPIQLLETLIFGSLMYFLSGKLDR